MTEKTLELFVRDSQIMHGDKYDYSSVVYTKDSQKVEIICKQGHGSFWQKAYNHRVLGTGCPRCGVENSRSIRIESKEVYLNKVSKIHQNKYDYTLTEYRGAIYKILVVCPFHGEFSLSADAHKRGQGCSRCGDIASANAKRGNLFEFIELANEVHSDKYDYSKITHYIDSKTKLPVICKVHGEFLVNRNNHLQGNGCPFCQVCGYNKSKPGSFYILSTSNVIKVGITNREPKIRLKDINKSSGMCFKLHSVIKYDDGELAYNTERQVLNWLKLEYTPVSEVFDGSTECFLNVDLDRLINFVTPLAIQTTELQSSLQ